MLLHSADNKTVTRLKHMTTKAPANCETIDLISNDLASLESTFMFCEHVFVCFQEQSFAIIVRTSYSKEACGQYVLIYVTLNSYSYA